MFTLRLLSSRVHSQLPRHRLKFSGQWRRVSHVVHITTPWRHVINVARMSSPALTLFGFLQWQGLEDIFENLLGVISLDSTDLVKEVVSKEPIEGLAVPVIQGSWWRPVWIMIGGGLLLVPLYFLFGVCLLITLILAYPFSLHCFTMAQVILNPQAYKVVHEDPGYQWHLAEVVWMPLGLVFTITHLSFAVVCLCPGLTSFIVPHLELAKASVMPFTRRFELIEEKGEKED